MESSERSASPNAPSEASSQPLPKVQVPSVYASAFDIRASVCDASILCSVAPFRVSEAGPVLPNDAVCVIQLSPQSLKKLSIVSSLAIKRYEEKWGKLATDLIGVDEIGPVNAPPIATAPGPSASSPSALLERDGAEVGGDAGRQAVEPIA